MKSQKILRDPRCCRLLFFACWLVYTSAYIGRNTFQASIATLLEQEIMTAAQAGLIGTCYFICYGTGHLINGILADRLSPFTMIKTGLFGSAVANLIMALVKSYPVMLTVWSLNGFLQSMMWSPILFIFSNIFAEEYRDRSILGMAPTVPLGTILAYLSVVVTAKLPWTAPFYIATVVLLAVFTFFSFSVHTAGKRMVEPQSASVAQPAPADLPNSADHANPGKKHALFPLLLSSGTVFMLFPVLCHGMLKDGVLTWVPTLVQDTYHVKASFSTLLAILLPTASLCGTYLSDFMYHRVFRKNEAATAFFFMALTSLPILAVLQMNRIPIYLSVICLAMISLLMTSFNYMFSTILPTRFSRYHCTATVSGIFNSTIYLGSAISSYGFGSISEKWGWGITVAVWLAITGAAAICLLCLIAPWKRFIQHEKDGE